MQLIQFLVVISDRVIFEFLLQDNLFQALRS